MKLSQLCKKEKICNHNLFGFIHYRKHKDFIDRYWDKDCIVAFRKNGKYILVINGKTKLFFLIIRTNPRYLQRMTKGGFLNNISLDNFKVYNHKIWDNLVKEKAIQGLR